MPYFPNPVPSDINQVLPYLQQELKLISESENSQSTEINYAPQHVAPTKPYKGQTVYADGTDWNPGNGEGLYQYNGTVWTAFVQDLSSYVTLTGTQTLTNKTLSSQTADVILCTTAIGAPTFTTRSAGSKLVLYPAIAAASGDAAIGAESGATWFSTPTTAGSFKWYSGTTNTATLSGTGNLTISGNQTLNNSAPIIALQDTDHRSSFIHQNSGFFYVLRGTGINSNTYTINPTTGRWPLQLDVDSGVLTLSNDVNMSGDLIVYRYYATTTGAIFFNASKSQYLYYDGANFQFTDGVFAAGIFLSSDERLKTDITPLSGALTKLKQINGKSYKMKGKDSAGVLAQDLLNVMPSAVRKKDGDTSIGANGEEITNYYSVDYNQIIALLVESVKELSEEVEQLKRKNK